MEPVNDDEWFRKMYTRIMVMGSDGEGSVADEVVLIKELTGSVDIIVP